MPLGASKPALASSETSRGCRPATVPKRMHEVAADAGANVDVKVDVDVDVVDEADIVVDAACALAACELAAGVGKGASGVLSDMSVVSWECALVERNLG